MHLSEINQITHTFYSFEAASNDKKTEKYDSARQRLMCMCAAWKTIVQISKM